MKTFLVCSLAATFALIASAPAHAQTTIEWITLSVEGKRKTRKLDAKGVKRLKKHIRSAAKKLRALAKKPAPKGIPEVEAQEYEKSRLFWRETAVKLDVVGSAIPGGSILTNALGSATGGGNFGDTPGLNGGDMVSKMAAMNMQFLALQEATQMESRRFNRMSTASKARHDIAMNAIRNMK